MTARINFERELTQLHERILLMSSMVEEMLQQSIEALKNKDISLAQKVIKKDDGIDEKELEIQDFCIQLIARQRPLAKDLRLITASLKIITDLERIADHAVDISKITLQLSEESYIKPLIDIPRMAELAKLMMKDSIDSYVKENAEFAKEVAEKDDEIDHLFKQIYRELLVYMMEDPSKITQATHFLFVARYLERVADHTTNICEAVIYLVTGIYKDLNA
ncbi:phosphate signaling complex protein PhoU [Irregularibacter muris]|uniref:Phosphate-specific transport system accessory protein PhoU n=1 Tax=Irregularibacter muris TaxID=1796619 RepID=A0AAE3HGH7_9FIRM|nr:phosphate signaling complex protein PhoU [Irregularibacter muris]MCR1899032.1 phosphate signaling complex protein PhoU [Irregularibacter muris]